MASAVGTQELHIVTANGETSLNSASLQGTWSTEQYLLLTNYNSALVEFTDGSLEVLPMPTKRHQAIVRFLFIALSAFLDPKGGTVFFAPLRLQLRWGKFREPDLIVALDRDDPRLQDEYFLGADLVMEVVSPDNPERDTVVKRSDYAEAGIPEYWIVNPLDESVTVLRLEGAEYREHRVFKRGEEATSPLLSGFSVEVDAVFDVQ